jgi:two-component system OmpR family response regulator
VRPIILLVEKDESYAQFIKKTLIDKGYEVILCSSGSKALKKIGDKKIDLILTDYYLPDLRGDDFYNELREIKEKTPVIFMSQEAHKKTIKNILRHSHADYIVKPFVMAELMARLEVSLEENKKIPQGEKLKVEDLELDIKNFKAVRAKKPIKLSPTEFALLKYLMINKNTVLTRGMILSRI